MSRLVAVLAALLCPSLAAAGGSPPSRPLLVAPTGAECVRLNLPNLEVDGSSDPDGDPITYHFELDSDPGLRSIHLQVSGGIPEDPDGPTRWRVERPLQDCSVHYWRAWASDGSLESDRVDGSFETCVDECESDEGDGGPAPDGAGGSARRGGCSCSASAGEAGAGLASFALLVGLRRRR